MSVRVPESMARRWEAAAALRQQRLSEFVREVVEVAAAIRLAGVR